MNDAIPQDDEAVETLVTEAADDFLDRARRGEEPDVEDYAGRYPQVAGILRQLLPAVRLMHRSGSDTDAGSAPNSISPGGPNCLGDFRLVREIGRGGMGVVYEAEQVSLGRRVALKVLPLAASLDPRQLQRFRLEAQAAAHLHHSHIVPIYSVGCERGVYYYAMQYVEGRSLAEVIARLRPHPGDAGSADEEATAEWPAAAPAADTADEPRATAATAPAAGDPENFESMAALAIQAAEALDHAHAMGVVHRDIKPANLLVDARGTLYVTDFGLARLQGDAGLTMTGDLVGTLRYMSPEQALAQREVVDHRTDIYSLGATLYELLTLAPPFDAPDRHALLRQIVQEEPVPLRQRARALPVDLETIVLRAMAKEPGKRYATAKELADDLRRFLEHRPILARRPTLRERVARWSRRHRPLVASAVGLLLLTALGLAASTALIAREQWKTQAAYDRLSEEQAKTQAAYEAEAEQRVRAEKSLRQARQIVDFFTEVSEEELAGKAELQGLRRMLLAAALDYYQDFIAQGCDDPSLQAQLAASHLRVASILDQMGSQADALAALERARQLQEKLVRSQPAAPELQQGLYSIYSRFDVLRGGRELGLLSQKSVQEDLKLSDDQVKQVAQLGDQRRGAFRDSPQRSPEEWRAHFEKLPAQEAALAHILRPEQARRLRQIALQQRGNGAFGDPDVAEALRLTREQRQRIRALQEETRRSLGAGYRSGEFRPRDWKKAEDSWKKTEERIHDVLTNEQKARWAELTGEPFKGKIRPPHRGGPSPRPGPPGPRGPRGP